MTRCDVRSTHVTASASGDALDRTVPVTLHFHPDLLMGDATTLEAIADEGRYRSQFETGTSNGGLTAHEGGDRWSWESRMFGGAYDDADPGLRPKYGSLNFLRDPYGGSPRFGSAYFEVAPGALDRVTFCFPDSVYEPTDFGTFERMSLVPLVDRYGFDDPLDLAIEAHLHGPVDVAADLGSLVLDPSYRGTRIEEIARGLPCRASLALRVPGDDGRTRRTSRLSRPGDRRRRDRRRRGRRVDAAHHRCGTRRRTTTCRRSSASGTRSPDSAVETRRCCSVRTIRCRPTLSRCGRSTTNSPVAVTPAGHVHAIDPGADPDPTIVFHSARGVGGELAGDRSAPPTRRCTRRAEVDAHRRVGSRQRRRSGDARPSDRRGSGGRRPAIESRNRHDGRVRAGPRDVSTRQDSSTARRSASTRSIRTACA